MGIFETKKKTRGIFDISEVFRGILDIIPLHFLWNLAKMVGFYVVPLHLLHRKVYLQLLREDLRDDLFDLYDKSKEL